MNYSEVSEGNLTLGICKFENNKKPPAPIETRDLKYPKLPDLKNTNKEFLEPDPCLYDLRYYKNKKSSKDINE